MDLRTKNQWERELRAALLKENKPGKAGPKACSVCGKPDTRNHAKLNEQNGAHGTAVLKAYPSQWRQLTKALEAKLDFTTKEKFNAQQKFLLDQLLAAREEHEKYEPTTNNAISNKTLVIGCVEATFKLLGFTPPAPPKNKKGEPRPWSVLQLTEMLNLEVAKLLGVPTDVTLSEHPAEEEEKADGDKGGENKGEEKAPEANAGQPAEQPVVEQHIDAGTPEGAVVVNEEPTEAQKALDAIKNGSNGGTLSM